ncbi:MAG TPA: zinc chelation protein SecC [Gammaproteobacteria bacterium]|nr:zinc chelation protein SecC [Gammaproteobacteria bacterium]
MTVQAPSNKTKDDCCNDSSCCPPKVPVTRSMPKVGRNDPCPCGNGRKYKKCCGKN